MEIKQFSIQLKKLIWIEDDLESVENFWVYKYLITFSSRKPVLQDYGREGVRSKV